MEGIKVFVKKQMNWRTRVQCWVEINKLGSLFNMNVCYICLNLYIYVDIHRNLPMYTGAQLLIICMYLKYVSIYLFYTYKYHTKFQSCTEVERNTISLLYGSINTLNCYHLMVSLVSQMAPFTSLSVWIVLKQILDILFLSEILMCNQK